MFMVRLPQRLLLACFLPLGAVSPVFADEADVFNFRTSLSSLYDDNLFRTANSGGQKAQSDTVHTAIFGIDFNKRVSLQEFIAHVSWVETSYLHNDYLNAGVLRYDTKWAWGVGSHLKGELSADRSAAQNSFADIQNSRLRNLRTSENQRFGLDYAFHPSWHAIGGLSHQTVRNDQPVIVENDFEATGASAGIKYTPASGNWVSWQTKQYEGNYTRRPFNPASQFDNEFTQTGQEFAASWKPTGHSAFNGVLEYTERKHPHFSARNFSGWVGSLSYLYEYSAKTTLSATYQHGLNAFQDVTTSYYASDDVILGSRWAATAKIDVSARLGYSHRKYLGEVSPLAGPRREDDVARAGVDVSYKPAHWLELKAGLAAEKRNSSENALDYTDRQALLSANARF